MRHVAQLSAGPVPDTVTRLERKGATRSRRHAGHPRSAGHRPGLARWKFP